MRPLATLLLTATLFLPAGCAVGPAASPVDAAPRREAGGWIRSELYFGIGSEDGRGVIDEVAWRRFLDREVTPRFPDGLTSFEAYGQWRFKDAETPERLRSKVLVILHPDAPAQRAAIEALRAAWLRDTGHESVLLVQQPATVSF